MYAPYILVKTLCIACIVLNSISLFLCCSALILLLVSYFNLGEQMVETISSSNVLDQFNNKSKSLNYTAITTSSTTTELPLAAENEPTSHSSSSDSNSGQFTLIIYLLFYLIAALLGIFGAHKIYRQRKIYLLVAHLLLLFTIICFNLVAWFEFRAYSPLNATKRAHEDTAHLLWAALFDFVDLLVALCLLAALILNHMHMGNKQRNSIDPAENRSSSSS